MRVLSSPQLLVLDNELAQLPGLEVALPWAFSLTPTFFYHRYLGLTDFATTCGVSDNSSSDNSDGTDCIDKAYCREHGIAIANIRGYAVNTVPEHAMAMILALQRNLVAYRQDVIAGR